MKRIAFAAAAALLGTGCISSTNTTNNPPPEYGSVNMYWDFVRNAPAAPGGVIIYDDSDTGSPNGACNESRVDEIDVTSANGTVTVPCVYSGVEGIGIDALPAGNQSFTFRAWRGAGANAVLVYESTVIRYVAPNTTTSYQDVDLLGVPDALDMYGDLYNTGTAQYYADCAAATPVGSLYPPNIEYFVSDVWGNTVAHATVGCGGALPAVVFASNLDRDNYDVRMQGKRVEDNALVFDSCWQPLDHFADDTGAYAFQAVLDTNPIPTCP